MKCWDNDVRRRTRPRAGSAKQPLVVRQADEDREFDEVLERLECVEASLGASAKTANVDRRATFAQLDAKSIVTVAAILLSIAGYVIEDARSTSRQQAEIEATKVRVTNLEKITSANTEARIRSEVELDELRQGQAEIKEMLRTHENETRVALRRK